MAWAARGAMSRDCSTAALASAVRAALRLRTVWSLRDARVWTAVLAVACSSPRGMPHAARTARTPQATPPPAVATAGTTADAGSFPALWTEIIPGVQWRGARVPFEARSPDLVAWATAPTVLSWVVIRLDLAKVWLTVVHPQDDRFETAVADPAVVAAVNGGFFEPDHRPSGLLVSSGVVLGRHGGRGGTGL